MDYVALSAAMVAKYLPLQPAALAACHRASKVAIALDLSRAVAAASAVERQAQRADSRAAAGLVPSKTSVHTCINLSAPAVADRRVNRLKRSVWASGHLHGLAEKGFRASKPWFVTLTYASANSWLPCHVSDAIRAYRKWCKVRGYECRYTWVAEIQPKRLERTGEAVVHYHLLAWLPVGVKMPHWDRATRTPSGRHRDSFWCHGMSNTEIAKSGVGYLMKYLSKLGELTKFPKGLRLYGIGGLNDQGRSVRQWYNLPQWAKNEFGVGELVRKAGALVVRATGEILPPAFSIAHIPSGLVVTKLRETVERWTCGAYSSVSFS